MELQSTTVNYPLKCQNGKRIERELSPDPSTFFGVLTRGCIRDRYVDDGSVVRDSVISTLLGIGCSMLTLYVLSALGFFV